MVSQCAATYLDDQNNCFTDQNTAYAACTAQYNSCCNPGGGGGDGGGGDCGDPYDCLTEDLTPLDGPPLPMPLFHKVLVVSVA